MDLLLLMQFIFIILSTMSVLHSQDQAKGCPLINFNTGCNATFVEGRESNLGKFNEIGSVLKAWSSSVGYFYMRCQEDGTYNSTTTSCLTVDMEATCNASIYHSQSNLTMSSSQQMFLVGRVLRFSCDTGLTLVGPSSIYCKSKNTWNDSIIPECIGCPYPEHLNNGYYTDSKNLKYTGGGKHIGEIIIAHCNQNFMLQGYPRRTCSFTGIWTGDVQNCVVTACGFPKAVPSDGWYTFRNGSEPSSWNIPIGVTLNLKCSQGFSSSFNDNIICNAKGQWNDGAGRGCQIIYCKKPKNVENGYYMLESNSGNHSLAGQLLPYGTTIYVFCQEGFLNTGNEKFICDEKGSWSGANPKCEVVLCARPMSISHGYYWDEGGNSLTQNRLKYNTNITFHCQMGYKHEAGTFIRRCDSTGEWSGINPTCSPVTCNKLKETSCGYFYLNTTQFLQSNPAFISRDSKLSYNTTVLFVCNKTKSSCQNSTHMLRCSEDGSWIGRKPQCENYQQLSDTDTTDTNSDAIIGAVCGVISVLLIGFGIFIFFVFWKRRTLRRNKPEYDSQTFRLSISNEVEIDVVGQETYTLSETESAQEESAQTPGNTNQIYINTIIGHSNDPAYYDFRNPESLPKTAIKIDDLQDVVFNRDDTNKTFENQFQALPQGMVENCSEAVKLENKGKNRYTRLYAYDDTRVVLNIEEDSNSDYINACYVHGFNKSRKYIATQGPTKNTLEDFWRMVYQEDSSKIVMLTNLIEEGKNKCMQYWPEENTKSYGDVKVCLKKVETHSQFDTRTLSVQKGTSVEKIVTQFHFTVWPDKGIPRYASSLVHFLKKVNNASVHGHGPIIVHCSAGVGRTGTFIALDYLTDQGKTLGYVDVAGCVDALRRQRVSLVQTLDQYIFVHRALVESLMMSSSTILAHKYEERYRELQQIDTKKKKTRICLDFENLQRVSPSSEDSRYVSAKLVANRQKNRDQGVLPVEEFMPFLTNDHGRNIYINAVFLPSYNDKQAFIITQAPLRTTREEFWMLVWEQEVHTVVMMNSIDEIQNDEKYWPERKPITFSNIEISTVSNDKMNDHDVLTLSLKKKDTTRRIKQIQCGGWRKGNTLPDSPDIVLCLMDTVQAWQQQSGNHKILVHCMNGADRSGLFCVISSVIERMKIEQDVAIASVVEEMRNAREQIIPSLEQYQFCHETVLHFIQQYDTYSNFRS